MLQPALQTVSDVPYSKELKITDHYVYVLFLLAFPLALILTEFNFRVASCHESLQSKNHTRASLGPLPLFVGCIFFLLTLLVCRFLF